MNLCNTPQGFPVGLESGNLPNSAISVSSSYSGAVNELKARLNGPTAWAPLLTDEEPWLQIKFDSTFVISAIITQGRADHDQWVTSYTISTKLKGQFTSYTDMDTNTAKV